MSTRAGPRGPYSSGLATRDLILAAATEVFARAGDTGFGMRDVAKAASVSHPTVCYHFASRIDLMRAVHLRFEEAMGLFDLSVDEHGRFTRPRMRPRTMSALVFAILRQQQRPDAAIMAMYDCRFLLYAADPLNEFHSLVRARGDAINRVMVADIARMQQQGLALTKLHPDSAAMLIINAWMGVAMAAAYPARDTSLPGSVRFVASLVELLDMTPEGLERWEAEAPEDVVGVWRQARALSDGARGSVL